MQAAPAFTHLTLTGGAIGCGPPLAVGAALAQPRSVVINIQVGHKSGQTVGRMPIHWSSGCYRKASQRAG